MQQKVDNLIWLDLEMTGLDTANDYIIEIATVITDSNLTILAEGPVLAIHQSDEILSKMDSWNTKQHQSSGLIERVKLSTTTEQEAEQATLAFLQQYVPPKKSPMCGNSICQDRRFLSRCMPQLEAYFHYRNLDVSTIKELALRWKAALKAGIKKDPKHLSLEDIKDSIKELIYYRENFFKLS